MTKRKNSKRSTSRRRSSVRANPPATVAIGVGDHAVIEFTQKQSRGGLIEVEIYLGGATEVGSITRREAEKLRDLLNESLMGSASVFSLR